METVSGELYAARLIERGLEVLSYRLDGSRSYPTPPQPKCLFQPCKIPTLLSSSTGSPSSLFENNFVYEHLSALTVLIPHPPLKSPYHCYLSRLHSLNPLVVLLHPFHDNSSQQPHQYHETLILSVERLQNVPSPPAPQTRAPKSSKEAPTRNSRTCCGVGN
jgi:hypothetical protein